MTIIGETNVVHFDPSVKVCRERPVCRSGDVAIITRGDEWNHVMPRSEYNPCRQNETTHRHVIPREQSESRNLPELQILSCVGSLSNVVDSSTPLTLRSE